MFIVTFFTCSSLFLNFLNKFQKGTFIAINLSILIISNNYILITMHSVLYKCTFINPENLKKINYLD